MKHESHSESLLFEKLSKGSIDALIIDHFTGEYLFKDLSQTTKDLFKSPYQEKCKTHDITNIGFANNDQTHVLQEIFNTGYASLKADGTLERIEKKYLG